MPLQCRQRPSIVCLQPVNVLVSTGRLLYDLLQIGKWRLSRDIGRKVDENPVEGKNGVFQGEEAEGEELDPELLAQRRIVVQNPLFFA